MRATHRVKRGAAFASFTDSRGQFQRDENGECSTECWGRVLVSITEATELEVAIYARAEAKVKTTVQLAAVYVHKITSNFYNYHVTHGQL